MLRIVFLVLYLTVGMFCVANGQALEDKLRELDHVMERRYTYYKLHEHKIDSLKKIETTIKPGELEKRFKICHELFNAYRSYQNDSARIYVEKELDIAGRMANPEHMVSAQYDNVFAYMSKGDFTNAVNVLNETTFSNVSDSLKAEMYVLAARLYSDLSNFTSDKYEDGYAKKSYAYGDSAATIAPPGSYASQFATYFLHGYMQNKEERIATFEKIIDRDDVSPSIKAMIYSMLGDLYISDNQVEKGLIFKAESAITDIKSAIRETTSKHFLAYELFRMGDVNRATKYIHVALEDAESYNAPQRKAEIGRSLSLIEASRYSTVKEERDSLWIILAVTFVFIFVIAGFLIFIRRKNLQLKESSLIIQHQNEEIRKRNADITKANDQLRELNSKLGESIKIKDEYLGYVFYLISEYIKKIESLYKIVNLKLKIKQPYDLLKAFPASDIRLEKEKMLKEFDRIFLSLFPSFVEQYNQLFDESSSNAVEMADGILTPEMRIFALIRLGVKDTNKIAQFLNYSVNTINTYKTKAKKRSIVSNEEFEARIMKIQSVK